MRTLVLGGTGMVGQATVRAARRRGWPALGLDRDQVDIEDAARVDRMVAAFRPGLVVNCAALAQVDACESEPERTFAVNGTAVGNVAAACARGQARLVHVSTDYVFDGSAQEPYREEDPTGPRSVYGAAKLEGERRAAELPGALVVRTSWVFGPGGPNFVATIRALIAAGRLPLRVVADQVGAPTYSRFLARALLDLGESGAAGVVHYQNREPVSWFDFAREIASLSGARVEILPVSTREFPRPAPRPAYSVLSVARFEALTGRAVEDWRRGLAEYVQEMESLTS